MSEVCLLTEEVKLGKPERSDDLLDLSQQGRAELERVPQTPESKGIRYFYFFCCIALVFLRNG